jgi:hypothetical protein
VTDLEAQPGGRVIAHLTNGNVLELPAVSPADIPTLVAAAGSSIAKQPAAEPTNAQ